MLSRIKKMLVVIPCMILGIFLFSNVKVSAADAELVSPVNKIVIGQNNKDNTYYFTNDTLWEFKAEYSAIKEWDTYLKYRVVKPDGKATDWSGNIYYVDNGGKFTINSSLLNFNMTEDMSLRTSVAPLSTYYVDIEYYGRLIISWNQNKGETIKIVVNSDTPTLNVTKSGDKYNVNSTILRDGEGASIVTSIDYFFSTEVKNINNRVNFKSAMGKSQVKGNAIFTPSSNVSVEISSADSSYKYLYVMSTSGNGYSNIVCFNIEDSVSEEQSVPVANDTSSDSGLFDYGFGELILLVLVVVLIVSCALIITQKIVDYKKRLF